MPWSPEQVFEATVKAPLGGGMYRDDSRVIKREGWYQVVTPSTGSSILNEVAFSQLAAKDADSAIDETIATYHSLGLPVKWCVGPWTRPDDFGDRLTRRGFEHWDVRGMVCKTSLDISAPKGVVIEAVEESNLRAHVDAFIAGWDLGEAQTVPMLEMLGAAIRRRPQKAHIFSAIVDGTIAGTTALLLREGYAYMVGANVLPMYRGRGLYRTLIAARLQFLKTVGVELAVTHAREATSAPMLEHLGWQTVFRSRCYMLPVPSATR